MNVMDTLTIILFKQRANRNGEIFFSENESSTRTPCCIQMNGNLEQLINDSH